MEALAILPFLFLILFGDFGSSGAEVEDTDEADDNGPEPQNNTEETPTITPIIFDDTNDEDNGLLEGTDVAELFIGSLEANGPEGFNSDVTNPNDTITALGGNDTVIGGNGEDQIDGGEGNDLLSGGLDNDTVVGGLGDDTIAGNEGNNFLQGDEGDDVFIIDDAEEGVFQYNTIADFSNEEGDRDFVDLTSYFTDVEEAQQAFDEESKRLPLDGRSADTSQNYLVFAEGFTPADLTPETTGLAQNIAPVAVDDTVTITGEDYVEAAHGAMWQDVTVQIDLVGGQGESAVGADSDADGDNALLKVHSINGYETPDEGFLRDPMDYGVEGVWSIQNAIGADGLRLILDGASRDDLYNGKDVTIRFPYTVTDALGGESSEAQVVVKFVAPDDYAPPPPPPPF